MFVFRKPLFTVIMAPKCKSSDAGSASKLKRSRDILSIKEKVKILDMMEIEKKSYAEISLLYRLLRIRLKHKNPLLSYVREREKVHCKCTM